MSEYEFQASPGLRDNVILNHTVEDLYHITRGTFKEFSMQGYNPPSTAISLYREHKIPGDKNRDIFASVTKRAKDPAPVAYAIGNEKLLKQFWNKATGGFHTYRRHTFTEDAMKRSQKIPGPGAYLDSNKDANSKDKKFALGKFSKSKADSFMCNTEALSEEVPAANAYFSTLEDREKAYARIEKKAPAFKYIPDKKKEPENKAIVGPGYLSELEASFGKKSLRKKTPDPVFGKEKLQNTFDKYAARKKYVPGVGSYKDTDRAFKSNIVWHKDRMPYISKSTFNRFSEQVSKDKQWVPGPGSYDTNAYSKKK
ncbi:hypothetical protein SteCoe_36851 [Stentor coeruleus]|uniref:Uncharacterized protein n=1 Tax=Stentor coeruleus TaxID=5963 RepID=A0A1R2AP96_9CILI|nr:hypothetical protein SteCoe_36851 [Stentor coeruleus]